MSEQIRGSGAYGHGETASGKEQRCWTFNVFMTPLTDAELKRGEMEEDLWVAGYPRRLSGAVATAARRAGLPKMCSSVKVTVIWVFPRIPKYGRIMLRSSESVLAGLSQAGAISGEGQVEGLCGSGLINPRDPRVVVTIEIQDDESAGALAMVM